MTGVVAVFHTDCCCSSSSFAGFNPQLFTRPCNTSASSVMQTLFASAGKTSFITTGDARRSVRKTSGSTCTDSLRLHSSSPECRLLVRSSKLSEPKTTKDHRSLPHKSLVNSAPVLLTDHPAPTSEFSAEEEEEEEEANSSSTSRGDLDSDPAASLLSPVLIRQQQEQQKKKKDAAVNKKKKSTVKSPSIQEAAAAAGKGQSLLPVDQTGSPTKEEGSNSRGKKKNQQQQSVPLDQMRSLTKEEGIRKGKKKTRQQQSLPVDQMGSLTKDGSSSSSRGKKKTQQQQHKVELLSNSSDEYERMLMNLIDQLQGIHLHALALERWHAPQLKKVHSRYQESARNLLHYVAFRSLDIAGLQETLTSLGLSSLESCEACTLASVNSVISSLRSLLYSAQVDSSRCIEWTSKLSSEMLQCATQEISRQIGQGNLSSNSQELLGPLSSERGTHIMVTLPSESALEEDTLIQTLLKAGMNVARVNCAHDGPETWSKMIHKVRYFSQLLETPCRVMMDLAGPKLRTGPMRPGPSVLKLKPFKDDAGEVTSPARVWLASQEDVMKPAASENRVADASIPIMEDISRWHKKIAVGDIFKFKDRKGRSRELLVVAKAATGAWAECKNSAYIESGTEFTIIGGKGAKKCRVTVGELPQVEQAIVLRAGDKLMLTRESILGSPAVLDKAGNIVAPARVSCTLEQVFDAAKIGDPIKFDEGKITGVISAVSSSEICVEITDAGDHKGRKLRGEKAINLPQTDLAVCGLTAKDTGDLDFVATNGDIVALSFVNGPSDVHCLQTELRNRGAPENLGIVLKIETELGFQRLPAVLLQAMETRNSVGVMVARGDMAVECGWQRLAEMQDQILVTCEASHVPTIWATQVLEGMAKSGIPSRAEITDAASGSRAECVMLNKGPHIMEAVSSLDDILRREACHRRKNHAIMHPLSHFQNFQ
ncbi:unnamed protein product [Sphagnum jensenii]|uniref:pyruvate kinase n=1 Tax=Sphagnum jensenii TaxID=128206 RepID=A0ABP0X5U0_9BRYO